MLVHISTLVQSNQANPTILDLKRNFDSVMVF